MSTREEDNNMQAKRGFTLVEILIVVVILGILAAIVIPQFTQASTEAKTNSLCSDLQTLRSQIELYKVQHNDTAPALLTFENQMVYTSDIAGAVSNPVSKARAGLFQLGPYLERVPENPFNGLATIGAAGTVDNSVGWGYDPVTGEIRAADTAAHALL
jgi:general secretion pathway protein G